MLLGLWLAKSLNQVRGVMVAGASCLLALSIWLTIYFVQQRAAGNTDVMLLSNSIAWFDRHIVDGTFNFMAWGANEAGESIRPWQSGDVRQYAVWFLTGTVALALILLAI
jgi:hypothetical protein